MLLGETHPLHKECFLSYIESRCLCMHDRSRRGSVSGRGRENGVEQEWVMGVDMSQGADVPV